MFLQFILVPPNLYEENSTPNNISTDVSTCPSKKSGLSTTSTGVIMNEASSHKNLKLYNYYLTCWYTAYESCYTHQEFTWLCSVSHEQYTMFASHLLADTQESSVPPGWYTRKLSLHWNYVLRTCPQCSQILYSHLSPNIPPPLVLLI